MADDLKDLFAFSKKCTFGKNWNLYSVYEYKGFNAEETVKALQRVADTNRDANIKSMVSINVMRGTNLENMQKKMDDSGRAKLNELIKLYNLKSGGKVAADVLTLARVALVFPILAGTFIEEFPEKIELAVKVEDVCPGCPKQLTTPSFIAMIPMNPKFDPLYYVFAKYQSLLSQIIDERCLNFTIKQCFEKNEKIMKASRKGSTIYKDEQKIEYLKKWGFLDDDGELRDFLKAAGDTFRDEMKGKQEVGKVVEKTEDELKAALEEYNKQLYSTQLPVKPSPNEDKKDEVKIPKPLPKAIVNFEKDVVEGSIALVAIKQDVFKKLKSRQKEAMPEDDIAKNINNVTELMEVINWCPLNPLDPVQVLTAIDNILRVIHMKTDHKAENTLGYWMSLTGKYGTTASANLVRDIMNKMLAGTILENSFVIQ